MSANCRRTETPNQWSPGALKNSEGEYGAADFLIENTNNCRAKKLLEQTNKVSDLETVEIPKKVVIKRKLPPIELARKKPKDLEPVPIESGIQLDSLPETPLKRNKYTRSDLQSDIQSNIKTDSQLSSQSTKVEPPKLLGILSGYESSSEDESL